MSTPPPDLSTPLDTRRICQFVKRSGAEFPWNIEIKPEIDSTNSALTRRWLEEDQPPSEGTVLFTEHQTAGRGRRGRQWFSPPCRNLMFSFLLRPTFSTASWSRLTLMTGLAVCETIESHLGLRPLIKWPNDIYFGLRKTGGILTETFTRRDGNTAAIIGVGLNVNIWEEEFHPEIRSQATSLLLERSEFVDRSALAAAILVSIENKYQLCHQEHETIIAAIRDRSLLTGRKITIRVEGTEHSGRVTGLSDNGDLLISTAADRETAFRSGEVVTIL